MIDRAPSILIVEDERLVAMAVRRGLELHGYRVTATVATAQAAFDSIALDRPDLVLMDVRIVGPIDGIDAAAQIQRDHGIPNIIQTGNLDPTTQARIAALAPIAIMAKPFDDEILRDTVAAALRRAGGG